MSNKPAWALLFIPGILTGAALLFVAAYYRPAGSPARAAVARDVKEPPAATSPYFDASWSKDAVWNDGLAEVAHYNARRMQYGKPRAFEAVLITVSEDFNRAYFAKAEPPYEGKRLLPVLKLNVVTKYDTENYPYSYLTSVFVDRQEPSTLVKLTNSSQEWCGNTFKELKTWGGKTELLFHSYWDGEGDGALPLDWRPGDLAEDQLPVSLRGLRFAPGLEVKTRLLPSLILNAVRKAALVPATLRVEGAEKVAGVEAWRVSLKAGELEQSYWFEKAAPHVLVKFTSSDGREMTLKSRKRWAYWKRG